MINYVAMMCGGVMYRDVTNTASTNAENLSFSPSGKNSRKSQNVGERQGRGPYPIW